MLLLTRICTLTITTALGCSLLSSTAQAHWNPPVVNHYKRVTDVHNNYSWQPNYGPTSISKRTYDVESNRHVRNETNYVNNNTGIQADHTPSALWVLSVGVNCNRVQPGKPADDHAPFATQVAGLLQQHGKPIYGNVHTRVLTGPRATRQSILAGFDWLRNHARPGDVSVIFLSGHGGENGGHYFMVPAKTGARDWKADVLWGQEMRESLLEIPGRKVLLLNTCSAAGILQTPVATRGLPNTEIICCTRAHEIFGPAFAMDKALVRGLKGAAVNQQGVVTVGSLVHYLTTQVKQVTHDREHVTVAGPHHLGANYGATVSSLSHLPLGV